MKAVILKKSKLTIVKMNKPIIGTEDILVKMQSCGICGSDVEKVFGRYGQKSTKLGHEISGVITNVGKKISGYKIGERVFVHHHVPCYSCHYCDNGNETMCDQYNKTNIFPCGLSEFFLVPKLNIKYGAIMKIPNYITFEQAAMIEPLACCIRSWKKFNVSKNYSVSISGMGSTGIMHAMLAKIYGAKKIICIDTNEFRLDFTKKLGLITIKSTDKERIKKIVKQTESRGIDIAIIATSNINAILDAIQFIRKGGKIMLFGVPEKHGHINIDINKIYSKEISLMTSYAASNKDIIDALKLIKSKKIEIEKLITHRYSILESHEAFIHARKGTKSIKIMITN